MPTTPNRLTPEKIAAMRAAQARVAPHLPPLMAQGLWIARLNGDYDPPNGKYSVPAWGVYQPDGQSEYSDGRMPGSYAPIPPRSPQPSWAYPTTLRDRAPNILPPSESPFVNSMMATLSPMAPFFAPDRHTGQPADGQFGDGDSFHKRPCPLRMRWRNAAQCRMSLTLCRIPLSALYLPRWQHPPPDGRTQFRRLEPLNSAMAVIMRNQPTGYSRPTALRSNPTMQTAKSDPDRRSRTEPISAKELVSVARTKPPLPRAPRPMG